MFKSFRSWLKENDPRGNRQRRSPSTKNGRLRLRLDQLEDRTVMDAGYWNLATQGALVQDWSAAGQINTNNNWVDVPSIIGSAGIDLDKPITAATQVGTRVTITTALGPNNTNTSAPANRFVVGQQVQIDGVNVAGYNGTFTVVASLSQNQFQFETTAGLAAGSGGTAASTTLLAQPASAVSGINPQFVNANQTDPNTIAAAGVTEFEIANPTIALKGDPAADSPYLQVHLNSVNANNIRVQYTVRDLDSTANNANQAVSLQYRTDGAGGFGSYSNQGLWRPVDWTNVPAAYIADATDPNSATKTTNVDVILPTNADGKTFLQLRIITANAVGADEYVGIDDLRVSAVGRVNLTAASASEGDGTATVTVTRTNGSSGPVSATFSTPYAIATATSAGSITTITTTSAHSFVVGQSVVVAGVSVAAYNGTFTITAVTGSTFTYTTSTPNLASGAGGTVNNGAATAILGSDYSAASGLVSFTDGQTSQTFTVPLIDNGDNTYSISGASSAANVATITTTTTPLFVVGQTVNVSGVSDSGYDGNYTVTAVAGSTFSYAIPATLPAATGGTASGAEPGQETVTLILISNNVPIANIVTNLITLTSTVTTANAHGFSVGQQVVTAGLIGSDTAALISTATSSGTTATVTTTASHAFVVGQQVTVEGVSDSGYNGLVTITATTGTTFKYTTVGSDLPAGTGGTTVSGTSRSISSAASIGTAATITTNAPHSFVVGQQVKIAGMSVSGYNGDFTITAITASTFSYTTSGSNLAAGTGGTANSNGNIDMFNDMVASIGGFVITSVPTATSFTFQAQNSRNGASGIASSGIFGTVRLASAALIGTASSTLNINDNDGAGTVELSAANYTVGEGKGTAIITVTRSGSTAGGLVVSYAASQDLGLPAPAFAGFDFTATTGTVSFAAGETAKTFTVTIANDSGTLEGPEAFVVTLSNLVGGPSAVLGAQIVANVTITEPGQISIAPTTYTVSEAGGIATVTVNRINATTGAGTATVFYSTSNGSATAGADYVTTTGTLTWADGDITPKTFDIPITNDADFTDALSESINVTIVNSWTIATASETGTTATITTSSAHGFTAGQQVIIRGISVPGYLGTYLVTGAPTSTTFTYETVAGLANASGGTAAYDDAIINTGSATVNIIDNDGEGTVAFAASDYSVGEGKGNVTLTVNRTGSANGPLTVAYATSNNTATGGDYSTATGTLTWANGDSAPKTLTVNITNDATTIEGAENLFVTLSNFNSGLGAPLATLGSPNPATVTITEPGQIQYSASSYTVSEGTAQLTVTVNRVNGSAGPATVQYATANGSATSGAGNDYTAASGAIFWADGDAAPKTFTIDINDDAAIESTETINLSLTNGVVATAAIQVATTATITTATDHGFAVGQRAVVSGVSVGGYNGTFLITAVTANTFSYETTGVLAAGAGGLVLTLDGPTIGSPSTAAVNLGDNDGSGVIDLSAATYTLAESATGPIVVTVNRTGATTGTVSVAYTVSGGTATIGRDFAGIYTATANQNQLSGTLTFGPGVTSQTFQIRAVDDNVVEGDETINVALSNVLGGGALGTITGAVVTLTDSEPGRAVFSSSTYSATENGGNLTITVNRAGASTGTLTVPYSTINGVAIAGQDFVAVTGTLTWLPGDTDPKTFVVPLIDDFVPEGNESFKVSLGQTGLGTGTSAAEVPAIWYNFDTAADASPIDGIITDQGPNGLNFINNQRNGASPTSGTFQAGLSVGPAPEQINTVDGAISSRASSGATFPGAGEAYNMEGGRSRTYDTFEPITGTQINIVDQNTSYRDLLAPWSATSGTTVGGVDRRTYFNSILNSGNNNAGHSAITYSFWLQLPELVGNDFSPNRYPNGNNLTYLIGRSSASATTDGGLNGSADFGGQVMVRTIPNYTADPDYNPFDKLGTVKYTFALRGNQQTGSSNDTVFPLSATTFRVGEWNQFAVTYTPTETRIYKNGVLSETVAIGTLDQGKNAIEEIEGYLNLNQVAFLSPNRREQGTFNIDDFGLWTQQLTDADILEIYQQGIGAAVENTATVTISADTEANGAISFTSATYSTTEGDSATTATISVTRDGTFGAAGIVSIDLSAVGGSATVVTDYALTPPTTLSWADGETGTKDFTISIVGDLLNETNETVNLSLINATGGAAIAPLGAAVLTINDNDAVPTVSFSTASGSASETVVTRTVTVTMSAPSGLTVTVPYTIGGLSTATSPADYTISPSSLTFAPGEISKDITITVVTDNTAESNETIILNLGTPTNATVGATGTYTETIVDNDLATTTALVATPNATTGGELVTFTATISPNPGALGTVTFRDNGVAFVGGTNVVVVGGEAVFQISSIAIGSHPTSAAYTGVDGFANSVSNSVDFVVTGAATTTVLSVGTPNPALTTQALTFNVTVSGGNPTTGEAIVLKDASNGNAIVPTTGGTLAGGSATLTVAAGALTPGTHQLFAAYAGNSLNALSQSAQVAQVVAVAPQVVSVTPNGNYTGLAASQRSRVVSVVVVFNQPVDLDATAAAIAVHTNNVVFGGVAGPVGVVPTTVLRSTTDNITWVFTFDGNTDPTVAPLDGLKSLQDGVYDFSVDPTMVHPAGVGGISGSVASTTVFHRLFGDVTGEEQPQVGNEHAAIIAIDDNFAFRSSFASVPNYQFYFDFDGDDNIGIADNFQFRSRFNRLLTWNT